MTTAAKQSAAPAGTGTTLQDTTRAEKSTHHQGSILATVGTSLIHWTQTTGATFIHTPPATVTNPRRRARGRPPDAEPPDAATSGGSPEPSSPATSSGLGDASILSQDSGPVYTGHGNGAEGKRTKAEERAARQAEATARRIGPASWAVPSASEPDKEHEVHATPGGLVCTCPARGTCWHLGKVAPLYAAQLRRQARADNAWIAEVRAPSLVGPERLAVLRQESDYPDMPVWGGARS